MRILIIKDNTRLTENLEHALEQQGYTLDVARSAAEGDEFAVVEHHDLIILDIMVPSRSDVELCRALRRQHVASPILVISALNSTADIVACLDAGADDYLLKPFHSDELLARLRSLLRRGKASENAVLRSGDLVMNLQERHVALSGVTLKVTSKEFALLEYMMRNPRRLLTRTMISESVWDMNYESGSNVIDVYVCSLRRKIDLDPKHPLIETVVGAGYRFRGDPEETPASPAPIAVN